LSSALDHPARKTLQLGRQASIVNLDLDQTTLAAAPAPPAAAASIPVLIADDHPGVRRALEALVRSSDGLDLVGSAPSGEEAIRLAVALLPAVVVMDLAMPGLGGVEATRRIRALRPAPAVVALTGSRELIRDAVAAGAAATVLKDEDPQLLLDVIQGAAHGRLVAAKPPGV
jgi:DNA-binding NarL/FixJ family response regulator